MRTWRPRGAPRVTPIEKTCQIQICFGCFCHHGPLLVGGVKSGFIGRSAAPAAQPKRNAEGSPCVCVYVWGGVKPYQTKEEPRSPSNQPDEKNSLPHKQKCLPKNGKSAAQVRERTARARKQKQDPHLEGSRSQKHNLTTPLFTKKKETPAPQLHREDSPKELQKKAPN